MSTTAVQKRSIFGSAALVSVATAFSRVFGLVREQVMAYFFGAGLATDAFVVAFRIPNLLRDMFAEGALSSAFVPVFKEKLVNRNEADAFSLANRVLSAVLVFVGLIVLLGIIATPAIIYVSANGFTADAFKFDLTVSLTRLMFVYLLLVSLSAAVMGMLNSFGRFGIPALAPAVFNIGTIAGVWLLHGLFDLPIYAMAIGVLIGGLGQLLVQLPLLLRTGYRFRFRLELLDEGFKRVVRLFTPMVVGMSASRVNILVSTILASFLIEGAISYLNYSYRLMHFPLGVFAVALGTVALPRVSEQVARNDMVGVAKTFHETLIVNLILIIPSAAFLALWGRPLVELVYRWGEFVQQDAANTTLALLHYSYGLIGFAAVRVTVPVYYALGDSRLPMKVSIAAVVLNIVLYLPLIALLGFAGLAAATSLAGLANIALLIAFLPRRGVPVNHPKLWLSVFRIGLAAVLAMYASRLFPYDFSAAVAGLWGRLLNLLAPAAVGVILYLLMLILFRVRELGLLVDLIRRRSR